jgi:hypothetical protein
MCKHYFLFFAIVLLVGLIFFFKKEGLVTNIDEEVTFPVKKNELITKIQINCLVTSGDNWINLGDITIRDRQGNEVKYGNNEVYYGNKESWSGLPVQNLWDDSKASISASSREVENLIITLGAGVAVGSVQITNRQDCCWHRIANYRLSMYNIKNEELGFVNLDKLVGQGKTVRYTLNYT